MGVRAQAEFVRNFGPNRPLLSSMSVEGVLPSFLVEGGITRMVFEHYLEHMLLPALRPGHVLVLGLDNYNVHRGPSVERLVQEAGCEVLYLPSYDPDLNPMLFSNLEALVRAVTSSTPEAAGGSDHSGLAKSHPR